MRKKTGILILLMALISVMPHITTRAADTRMSPEIAEDWTWDNLTRPTQEFSEVFKATVAFRPTNVSARANKKTITVTADCNTAVRVILVEWSTDKRFWYGEQKWYRNVKYNQPVMVTRKSQEKYWPADGHYSSSTTLTYTQGKKTLYSRKTYHPRDQWGYLEATQATVDAARNKISFRKSFLIPNVPDCRSGYYVRITYLYTSTTGCGNARSQKVVVKAR